GQQESRSPVEQWGGEPAEPCLQGGAFTEEEELIDVLLDHGGRLVDLPGRKGVCDRFFGDASGPVPAGGPPVDLLRPFGLVRFQAVAEGVGEHAVVAPPPPPLIERLQEEVWTVRSSRAASGCRHVRSPCRTGPR